MVFMKLIFIQVFILCLTLNSFAANFPFPQNKVLYGIKTTTDRSSDVQSVYESWLKSYYEEQDSLARITWDTKLQSVSEGIGYGMLIMVCMDNAQNDTRTKFDKLWRYYKKFRNSNNVMNWKIDGFTNVASGGNGGATDGEVDAAAALILAYRQWGDLAYFKDAQELINAIWISEVNEDQYLKPGDEWDNLKNPSYFSTGGMELFKSVDSHDWSTVIANSFTLLKKVCHDTTGLPPDWCSQDGNDLQGEFGYDAVRVPWRMAWAYSWFGQKDAADIDTKITTWIRGATNSNPAAIKSCYTRDGSPQDTANAAYSGALVCAGLTSADNQDWVNAGFSITKNALANTYYKKTLQVLFMLLQSGNFPLMTGPQAVKHHLSSVTTPYADHYNGLMITSIAGRYFSLSGKKIISPTNFALQPFIRMR
jgi:endo-1,4-beta-D-glucanase Y